MDVPLSPLKSANGGIVAWVPQALLLRNIGGKRREEPRSPAMALVPLRGANGGIGATQEHQWWHWCHSGAPMQWHFKIILILTR